MERRETREQTTTTTSVAAIPYAGGWIGYDWFKLIVAAILAALLLWFSLNQPVATVSDAPAAVVPGATAAVVVPAVVAPAATTAAVVPAVVAPAATAPPAAIPAASVPTINAPTGDLSAGTYQLGGTGVAGQRIEVLINDVVAGTAIVAADGTWSLPIDLVAGSAVIIARPAGELNAATEPLSASVGEAVAVPPVASITPVISAPQDGAQVAAGPITISGTAAPGAQLEILDSDKVVGTATVAGDGTWSVQVTPESAAAAYSVRPVGSSEPATTAVRVTNGEVATCTELAIGCDAWVTREGRLVLRMRAAPGTSAEILNRLPVGAQMTLTKGPQPADDYTWWKVTTPGGQEGWIAGEQVRLQPD